MCVSQDRDFGKEIGLIHEMIVRGRKAGADRDFYKALAENEDLFKEVVGFTKKEVWQPVISQTLKLEVNRTKPLTELFNDLMEQLKPVVLSKDVPGLVKI